MREFPLLDEIGYSELKAVIEKYKPEPSFQSPSGDPLYLEMIEKRNVCDNLIGISMDDVKDVVLNFVNKWRCRIPYVCASELHRVLHKTHILFQLLKEENLQIESIDFDRMLRRRGKSVKNIIRDIFDSISKVKAGRRIVGFTATTKIMHMIIPDLFVMCDGISEKHGCAGNKEGYLNFLWRMQKATRIIIREKD